MLLCHKPKALIMEAPCAYFGSALCLFWKRPVLILEAPSAYFGSALCLFRKRMVFLVKLHACVLSWGVLYLVLSRATAMSIAP